MRWEMNLWDGRCSQRVLTHCSFFHSSSLFQKRDDCANTHAHQVHGCMMRCTKISNSKKMYAMMLCYVMCVCVCAFVCLVAGRRSDGPTTKAEKKAQHKQEYDDLVAIFRMTGSLSLRSVRDELRCQWTHTNTLTHHKEKRKKTTGRMEEPA